MVRERMEPEFSAGDRRGIGLRSIDERERRRRLAFLATRAAAGRLAARQPRSRWPSALTSRSGLVLRARRRPNLSASRRATANTQPGQVSRRTRPTERPVYTSLL